MLYFFTFLLVAGSVAASTTESPVDSVTESGTGDALSDHLTWGNWSKCSKSCGGGVQRRRRVCRTGVDLVVCLALKSWYRRQDLYETRNCNDQICEVTGEWGAWDEWLPCSTTCGTSGFEVRFRHCNADINNTDDVAVPHCEGRNYETRLCGDLPPCSQGQEDQNEPSMAAGGDINQYSSFFSSSDDDSSGTSYSSTYSS